MKLNRRSPFLWLSVAFMLYSASLAAAAAVLLQADKMEGEAGLTAFVGLTAAATLLLLVAVFRAVDLTLIKAARGLAVEIGAIVHGERRHTIDTTGYRALPGLPEAVAELALKLGVLRQQVGEAVAAATSGVETEKARLAAILNDLHEGVVLCNAKHQVVLYNQIALSLLHVSGEMGLGRPLAGLVAKEAVMHAFDVLMRRPEGGPVNAPFLTGTTDGRSLLQGRMSLVRAHNEITGYVITFNDVTKSVSALARRDALLSGLVDSLQDPVRRLNDPASDPAAAAAAALAISGALEHATKVYRSLLTGWWPMTDIHSADLFDFVIRRLDNSGLKVTMTGLPVWLHGDSHTLVLALDALLRSVGNGTGAPEFDLGGRNRTDGMDGLVYGFHAIRETWMFLWASAMKTLLALSMSLTNSVSKLSVSRLAIFSARHGGRGRKGAHEDRGPHRHRRSYL